MKISLTVLIIKLWSLQSLAAGYPTSHGKIYNGLAANGDACSLTLNEDFKGWTVSRQINSTSLLSFQSGEKIEMANSAWLSKDTMLEVSRNQFTSEIVDSHARKKINVLMRCKLNSKNEPIFFTVDFRDAKAGGSYKRALSCKIQ